MTRISHPKKRVGGVIFHLTFLIAFLTLTGLASWQVARLFEKQALQTQIDARVKATPVALPPRVEWGQFASREKEYLHLSGQGRYLASLQALWFGIFGDKVGYWVLMPIAVPGGGYVIVNRGFLPADDKKSWIPQQESLNQQDSYVGLLRFFPKPASFMPKNDVDKNEWFAPNVDELAQFFHLPASEIAPFFIDLDADFLSGTPLRQGMSVLELPNPHLGYALTWFTLAGILIGIWVYLGRQGSNKVAASARSE